MTPVLFDLETRSAADQKTVGGRAYAAHESTRVLTLCALIDGTFHLWIPSGLVVAGSYWPKHAGPEEPVAVHAGPKLPGPIADAATAGRTFVAHNCADFDAHVWWEKLAPVPRHWYDTLPAARAAGLPGELDELGKRLLGWGKDKGAVSILHKLMRGTNDDMLPGHVATVARYNVADVVLLRRVYEVVHGRHDEPEVLAAHNTVNARGVRFDLDLCKTVAELSAHAANLARAEVERLTGGAIKAAEVHNPHALKRWLLTQGIVLADDAGKASCRRDVVQRHLELWADETGN